MMVVFRVQFTVHKIRIREDSGYEGGGRVVRFDDFNDLLRGNRFGNQECDSGTENCDELLRLYKRWNEEVRIISPQGCLICKQLRSREISFLIFIPSIA